MDKVNFQDGTKVSSAKVTIDGVDYPVTPARYTGATPLSSTVMNTMQTNIENAINQNVDNIGGEDYDNTATYEEGDIVKYEGQLYICIEAIDTPEEWDSTKWSETDVLSSAGGNEVAIGTDADITGKTKIFIDESEGTDAYSEVVNSLSGNEIAKAPSVRAVNEALETETIRNNAGLVLKKCGNVINFYTTKYITNGILEGYTIPEEYRPKEAIQVSCMAYFPSTYWQPRHIGNKTTSLGNFQVEVADGHQDTSYVYVSFNLTWFI